MAKIHIKGLVAKKTAGGIRYYWEPNPIERKAGWKGMALGLDAIAAAQKAQARNEEVEGWRAGGASPRAVKKYLKPKTFGAVLQQYRREHLSKKASSTIAVAETALKRLDTWAGDQPVHYITRARVKVLREAMMAPPEKGGIGHHPAYAVLRMLRAVFSWAIKEELAANNPAASFDLPAPEPRDQIWEPEDILLFDRAAIALGMPSLGFAVRLAEYTGQREGDLIRIGRGQWKDVTMQCSIEQRDMLASQTGPDASRVMGFVLKQNKSKRTIVVGHDKRRVGGRVVGVPVAGRLREEIEQRWADQDERNSKDGAVAVTTLLVDDRTGLPWTKQQHFINAFTRARGKAVELARKEGLAEQADRIADLHFHDLRRTCVVRLFELGESDTVIAAITGHKIETTRRILEIYAPRTTAMAARAQVARIHEATATTTRQQKEQQG
jgi:integrase